MSYGIELARFVTDMAERLEANSHKATWKGMPYFWLIQRVKDELSELEQAIEKGDPWQIIREAADVANFCMMISDCAREETTE